MNDAITLRVRLHEAWDDVTLTVPSATPLAEVKQRVLDAMGEPADGSEFVVKFRGVELRDETNTLFDVGVPDGGALIVLRRRRRAVR